MKAQSGFTLVEIAIVLVIIGLMLGGVLQGQQLIENSRVRAAVNDFRGIPAAVNSYYERYRFQPGDDTSATQALRGANWISQVAGNGDGFVTSASFAAVNFTATPITEQLYFWNHLRAAGFVSGDPVLATALAAPRNPFGGATIITSAAAYAMPANQNKICMNNVPGTAANALDLSLDDGNSATGTFRASDTVSSTVPGASVYYEGTYYTVCLRL